MTLPFGIGGTAMLVMELAFLGLLVPLIAFFLWRALARPFAQTAAMLRVANSCDPEAVLRAQAMLRDLLTDEEYQQVNSRGYLVVRSKVNPAQEYHIPRYQGKVRVYEDGKLVAGLCLQPYEVLPDADVIMMHKLMLEGAEETYLAEANHFVPHRNGLWRLQT
ncbi:MAG: hypothetical protein M1319_07005 [Chloroflexi bacterium]|nr:hypothetical protein [Chloroflexota bacterium]